MFVTFCKVYLTILNFIVEKEFKKKEKVAFLKLVIRKFERTD